MSSDRDKLLAIMDSLEADYQSGKLSAEKYSYFRSKYEDKLNAIDARDATKRIRSMQGKSLYKQSNEKRSKKPTINKKKDNRQDLVQKYIINPKKDDAKYNKPKKQPMDSGTFKLLLVLVLVLGFTVGVGYGVFNLDFNSISNAHSVAIVQDTAFPEFTIDIAKILHRLLIILIIMTITSPTTIKLKPLRTHRNHKIKLMILAVVSNLLMEVQI